MKPCYADDTLIAEMYQNGLTIAQIARVLYMSESGIRKRLLAAGVQMRPPRRRPSGHPIYTDAAARRLWRIENGRAREVSNG